MQDIEQDLHRWGAWAREQLPGKIKALMIYQSVPPRGRISNPMSDAEGAAFDPAVAALRDYDAELYEIVRLHYLFGWSYYAIAKEQGRHTKDIVIKGRKAESFVIGFINGRVYCDMRNKVTGLVAP